MFDEVSTKEVTETAIEKNDALDKIKPESGIDLKEAEDYWNKAGLDVEEPDKKGGSYRDVYREGEGDRYEVHHMPADSASYLDRGDGPAIKMDKDDHRETASYGSSKEAQEYRNKQKELIDEGKFEEAVQMDIDDIKEKFGDKYDDEIAEMKEYINELKEEGRI